VAQDYLTPEAHRENATTLAAALGLTLDSASKALELHVTVTADPSDSVADFVAAQVCALLCRTVRQVSRTLTGPTTDCELIIGAADFRTSASKVFVGVKDDRAIIGQDRQAQPKSDPIPQIFGLLAACYACAATIYRATGSRLPFAPTDPFVLRFAELGIDRSELSKPIELNHTYMAGAGAIGNGLLWAAQYLDVRGQLDIVDDDYVSAGNLNRQIWFGSDDVGKLKVDRLVSLAQPHFPKLTLIPRASRLQQLPEKSSGPWLKRLIVAVDSRRARRALQNEFPGEVFDASTTDIREIVLHHHAEPTAHACLSCIYEPDSDEFTRERHIADHLGVGLDDVRSERISQRAASIIVNRFPSIEPNAIIGTAYDSLFKQLCSEGALGKIDDKRVVAPFAFISVLAGALLALELVRRLNGGMHDQDFNCWHISPWYPPLPRKRVLRSRQPGCTFCGQPILASVNAALWAR
jgi:hypothetical protein